MISFIYLDTYLCITKIAITMKPILSFRTLTAISILNTYIMSYL